MKIAIVGLWHLGTVTSLCLSKIGHDIEAFDQDKKKIENFKNYISPIQEPGINELLKSNLNKKINFNYNFKMLANHKIVWICYDTEIDKKDKSDNAKTLSQIKRILKYVRKKTVIIISSQVQLGTIKTLEKFDKLYLKKNLLFIYIPENLRLGNSIKLFLKPERIVFGIRDEEKYKKKIGGIFNKISCEKIFVSPETAEMTKHTINSFLACSISFINEIGQIAKKFGINFDDLEKCIKSDKRLGKFSYLRPGVPFSGGTLARDLKFLAHISSKYKTNNNLIKSIYRSNKKHSDWVKKVLKKNIKNKKTSILQVGIGYTENSSTIRRSFPFQIFKFIYKKCNVKIFDDYIRDNSNEIFNYKKYFLHKNQSKKNAFDIILIFKRVKNIDFSSQIDLSKSLVIDVNSTNKNLFLSNNINYLSYETEKNKKI